MRGEGEILLVSTYELGHPPHGVAWPAAFLRRAGFHPAALDLSVEPFDEERVRRARLVALSVPMHTALRLGLEATSRIRAVNPAAILCFHGLYAPLNARRLVAAGAAAVLGGECEEDLVALARAAEAGRDLAGFVRAGRAGASLTRLDFPVPDRRGLPPLASYARLALPDGSQRTAGYAEATRGCKYLCRHCPIPPIYGGRFFAVPVEVVLEDVAAQVAAGARHITFGDPDFLNGPVHALRVARAARARWPDLTFDFTAKVEHLVRHPAALAELAGLGALFVTSAVESLSDLVLGKLEKGHTRRDALAAFEICREAGLALRPSLVPFTPWSTLDDYLVLLEVFEARGLLGALDPVQLGIRLLVPPGSLLEGEPELAAGGLDEERLGWRWSHPDPRMDALQRRVARLVEEAARRGEDPLATVAAVKALALAAAGREHVHVARPFSSPRAPRLTESWYC
ncbi:MAG TPA: CUAEP/CCAEP-tail radical SAM protein [Anaeromyxobacteraceae bacterium]|nr:CUAEP/CCAEP-tail radical SAM protein [Anaeromyxobacteraceae bacterium]